MDKFAIFTTCEALVLVDVAWEKEFTAAPRGRSEGLMGFVRFECPKVQDFWCSSI